MKKIHRFIGDFSIQSSGRIVVNDVAVANQVRSVLKLNAGEQVMLADGAGKEMLVRIEKFMPHAFEAEVIESGTNRNEPPVRVSLYCSVLKKENFELVAQKATEIGVAEIIPVLSQRTVKQGVRLDRLEKIIRESAEQSGRGVMPKICEPLHLPEALAGALTNDENLFFEVSAETSVFDFIKGKRLRRVGIFIGPEGGWEPREVAQARDFHATVVNMGPLVLRAETAAIIASFIPISSQL